MTDYTVPDRLDARTLDFLLDHLEQALRSTADLPTERRRDALRYLEPFTADANMIGYRLMRLVPGCDPLARRAERCAIELRAALGMPTAGRWSEL